MLNPNSLALFNTLAPLPNNPSGGFNNFINLTPTINSTRDDEIRVDHNFNQKMRLMAEYLDERQTNGNSYDTFLGSPYTTNSNPVTTQNQLAQVHLTATLSSTMVNTTSVAMNNYVVSLAAAGIYQRSQVPGFNEVLPFEGGSDPTACRRSSFAGGWAPLGWVDKLPLAHASDLEDTLSDDWSWLRGNHYIQAGSLVSARSGRPRFRPATGRGSLTASLQAIRLPIIFWATREFYASEHGGAPLSTILSFALRPGPVESHSGLPSRRVAHRILAGHPCAARLYQHFRSLAYNPAQAPIVNADGSITPTANYNPQNGLIFNGGEASR